MLNLQDFLDKNYSLNEKIILACSTGPDSMFLLYKILETEYKKNIVACYFNHKLRKQSDEEELYLQKLGKEKGFIVETISQDINKIKEKLNTSIGIEELARNKRYDFFYEISEKYNTTKIITAHHLDDKIETFFFNLSRGSKLSGLINMTENNGFILRPLLSLTKKEILEYLNNNNIKFFLDYTNYDNDISRNFLRNEIIPKFEKINSKFKNNINNFLFYLDNCKNFIDEKIILFLDNKDYFFLDKFKKEDIFLQKEIIRYIFYIRNGKSTIGLTESNINEILKFLYSKGNKTQKNIKLLKMFKDGNKILF